MTAAQTVDFFLRNRQRFRAQCLHAQLDPDLRSVEEVIEMFRAFFNGTMPPADLDWRKFEI
jgi:dihydroorotase-like cyclic amidohydrolase